MQWTWLHNINSSASESYDSLLLLFFSASLFACHHLSYYFGVCGASCDSKARNQFLFWSYFVCTQQWKYLPWNFESVTISYSYLFGWQHIYWSFDISFVFALQTLKAVGGKMLHLISTHRSRHVRITTHWQSLLLMTKLEPAVRRRTSEILSGLYTLIRHASLVSCE